MTCRCSPWQEKTRYDYTTLSGGSNQTTKKNLPKSRKSLQNTANPTHHKQFFKRSQHEGETVDHFVTALKTLVKDCEFGDSLIQDNIICGVTSDIVRERMLRESNIDLTKAIEICRAAEASKTQIESLSNKAEKSDETTEVHKIGVKSKKKQRNKQKTMATKKRTCGKCGTTHAAVKMHLIMRINNLEKADITKEYADVFDGIGCFNKCHHIEVDENATPTVHPPRQVPFALRDRLEEEPHRLVEQKTVEKVNYPT